MDDHTTIIPVILSGGSGSRLWPLTRNNQPKQFLKLFNEYSLLQNTLDRVLTCTDATADQVITITNDAFLRQTHEQYNDFEPSAVKHLIGEPEAKNTAPAIAYAALYTAHYFGEKSVLWIVPADHHIQDLRSLTASLSHAEKAAKEGFIATFGITPTSAEIGYGYIKQEKNNKSATYSPIEAFVEKPDKETAQRYLDSGQYYWNSGMFVATAKTLIEEFELLAPEIITPLQSYLKNHKIDLPISSNTYASLPSTPFDIAIMEKTKHAVVVPCSIEWSDIGTWSSLWELGTKDPHGNVTDGRIAPVDTQNCLIHSNSMLIATIGLKDLAIIEDGDSILIADKNDSASLKKLVATLDKNKTTKTQASAIKIKPWGSIKTLSNDKGHHVKELTIAPHKKTSLHLHQHRNEFWTVIEGQAEVTLNDEILTLNAQDTLFIPIGAHHRIHNIGQAPLKIIEIQCGEHLTEDDIVRLSDSYGRKIA